MCHWEPREGRLDLEEHGSPHRKTFLFYMSVSCNHRTLMICLAYTMLLLFNVWFLKIPLLTPCTPSMEIITTVWGVASKSIVKSVYGT